MSSSLGVVGFYYRIETPIPYDKPSWDDGSTFQYIVGEVILVPAKLVEGLLSKIYMSD